MRFRKFSTLILLMDVVETARRPVVAEQGDEDGNWGIGSGDTRMSLLPLPAPDSPFPSSVIFRHRVNDANCQNIFDGVSRPRHYSGERVTVFFRELRQDEFRRVGYGVIRRDPQTNSGKVLRSQLLND